MYERQLSLLEAHWRGAVTDCHQARLDPFSLTDPKRLTPKTRVTRVPGWYLHACFYLAFLKVLYTGEDMD